MFSMFFEFLKVLKNHKGHYCVTGQAIFDLMNPNKILEKSEKYRKLSDCKNTFRFSFWRYDLHITLEKSKIEEMSGSDFLERHF